jgi:hypothetical protein
MTNPRRNTRPDPFPPSHLDRLFGVTAEPFVAALAAGAVAASAATVHHATNAAGTFFFHDALATLRDELSKTGWKNLSSGNLEYSMHPKGRHRVFVLAGDSNTGDALATPHSRRPRGSQGKEQVIQGQLDFALAELGLDGTLDASTVTTWALLHYFDKAKEVVKGEVSVPAAIDSSGCVTDWRARILLPDVDLGPGRIAQMPAGTPPANFEVRRKKA